MMITEFSEFIRNYPETFALIDKENKLQYPDAKFITSYIDDVLDEDEYDERELNIFFRVSDKEDEDVLWCMVHLDKQGHEEDDGGYIDEYYQISKDDAKRYHKQVFDRLYSK